MTRDFQQCGILTSVDWDEPVQSSFRLRNSKWCSVSSLTLMGYSSIKQRLWSDCAYAQADLRLCWRTYHIVGNLRHWLNYVCMYSFMPSSIYQSSPKEGRKEGKDQELIQSKYHTWPRTPHGKVTKTRKHHIQESQEVSPYISWYISVRVITLSSLSTVLYINIF